MRAITAEVRDKLKKKIKDVEGLFPDGLVGIVLFGSHARDEAKLSSDVDIALVFDEAESNKAYSKALIGELLEGAFLYLEMELFCTTVDKVLDTENKRDTNYWIREEGDVLWATTRI